MRKNEKGFTLLETVVTAGIAGVLAAVTFPNVSATLNSHRLMAGLRGTAGCIRAARSAAVMRHVQSQIVLSNGNATLTVQVNDPVTGWTSIGTPLVLEGGVTVSSVTGVAPVLAFNNTGMATNNSGGVVTLRTARGDTRVIAVGPLGRVDLP